MSILEAVARTFAKKKEDVLCTRWLGGELYSLVKERMQGEPATYRWLNDAGNTVSKRYRSRDMAEVRFGSWTQSIEG